MLNQSFYLGNKVDIAIKSFTPNKLSIKITLTASYNHHILYLNNSMQLNTMDEWLYHEPLVHAPMLLNSSKKNILILGGGDGCGIREVLKYPEVESIKIIDLDPDMTNFGANNPVFKELNNNSYHNKKVTVLNQDAFIALENDSQYYDLIIIDFLTHVLSSFLDYTRKRCIRFVESALKWMELLLLKPRVHTSKQKPFTALIKQCNQLVLIHYLFIIMCNLLVNGDGLLDRKFTRMIK